MFTTQPKHYTRPQDINALDMQHAVIGGGTAELADGRGWLWPSSSNRRTLPDIKSRTGSNAQPLSRRQHSLENICSTVDGATALIKTMDDLVHGSMIGGGNGSSEDKGNGGGDVVLNWISATLYPKGSDDDNGVSEDGGEVVVRYVGDGGGVAADLSFSNGSLSSVGEWIRVPQLRQEKHRRSRVGQMPRSLLLTTPPPVSFNQIILLMSQHQNHLLSYQLYVYGDHPHGLFIGSSSKYESVM
ncbi:hypothetical protein Tco_0038190 [Tanacetum coccineum]